MRASAWPFALTAFLASTLAAHAAETRGHFTVVGRDVGEGATTPPFWHEYKRVSASRDRALYDAYKRSPDPYDRALAIYLAPGFGDMPFVEAALPDTRFVEHGHGCIVSSETIGSLAYNVIRGGAESVVPESARYDKQRRIALARSILRSPGLIHLHGAAGVELGDLLGLDRNGEGCGAFEKLTAGQLGAPDALQIGRLLTSVNLPWRVTDTARQALLLRGYVMACAIARPDVPDEAKRYLIDFAYAGAPYQVDGRRFHTAAGRAPLAPALAAYEREQFDAFQKWKQLAVELDVIRTAAELHARVADIRRLFTVDHPMLLSDILRFDNSELHDSAALRRSKAAAVLRLVRACRDRDGLYWKYALAEARLYVMEQEEYARGVGSSDAQGLGFSAREYDELKGLLEIGRPAR